MIAAREGYTDCVRAIVEADVDTNATNSVCVSLERVNGECL
jgi:hypothetical protein